MKKLLFIVPVLFLLASCTNSTPSKSSSSIDNTQVSSVGNGSTSSVPKENRTVPTPSYGSGNHTLEIFADFQCPACQNFSKTLEPIFKNYADK